MAWGLNREASLLFLDWELWEFPFDVDVVVDVGRNAVDVGRDAVDVEPRVDKDEVELADTEELEEVQAVAGSFDTVPRAVGVETSHSTTTVFLVQAMAFQLAGRKASPNSKEWADPQEEEQTCLPRDR